MKKTLAAFILALPFSLNAYTGSSHDKMTLKIGQFSEEYEIKAPTPSADKKIFYVYDFVDNIDLIKASAEELARQILQAGWNKGLGAVVVPGDKANSIGALLTEKLRETNPSVFLAVLRGSPKSGSAMKVSYQSITHLVPKQMYIRPDQMENLKGKQVIIMDDVISTGATARAAKELVEKAGATVIGFACVATEGEQDPENYSRFDGLPLIRIAHFPVVPIEE